MLRQHGLCAVASLAIVMVSSRRVVAEPPEPPASVSVADIGTKVSLVGRLGQPLGTMMTIRGKWQMPNPRTVKDNSLRFVVSHVNGNQLTKPVEFNIAQLRVKLPDRKNALPDFDRQTELDGVVWTLRAYESGRYDGMPEEYWRAVVQGARPYYMDTFTSELVGILQPETREP